VHWVKRIFLGLLAVMAVVAGAVGIYVWRSLPADSAQYAVASKIGETTINIDRDGIPTIDAKSERDLAFAVGFMHARDRLWQLEMHRRIGRGELAEILGPKALDTDKFLRTLGIHRAARAQLANVPPEFQTVLQAYADGVNSYVTEAMTVRPPEFVILGVQPGTWEPVDTVAWGVMMAYDLSGNWGNELLRLQMTARMPVSRIDELLPPQPGGKLPAHADYGAMYKALGVLPEKLAASSTPSLAARERVGVRATAKESSVATSVADSTAHTLALSRAAGEGAKAQSIGELLFLSQGTEGIGSNNWVVNGSRTVSGKPLLANDPHLSLAAPAIWYFTRQKAPGIDVTGATLPGGPSVILGRTKGVAWGFTNTGPDVQDLYLEEINDKGEARTPDGWAKLATRVETFKVKGEPDAKITVRESRHGPIISDVHAPSANAINSKKFAIAMRWTALDADNASVLAAPRMNKAQTVAELKEALRSFSAPQQNVVMADTLGNTAFIAPGRVPIRKPENDINGLAPSPGWDAKYDWAGFLTFDQMPQQTVDTFLATANQRIHGNEYPHFISGEWAHPGRKVRIEELLAARPKHDTRSLREIQHDLKHTHDRVLLKWLPKVTSKHPLAADALRALSHFEAEPSTSSQYDPAVATLVYWNWARETTRRIVADEMGTDLFDAIFGRRDFRSALNGILARDDAFWCDDKRTAATENCNDVINGAFDAALSDLEKRYGSDVNGWRWDTAHFARSEHRPFSNVPILKNLFEIRTPTSGDTYTVMVGKVRLREPDPFANEFAASLRAVYDLSVPESTAATVIYSTGQSGNPFSPHYRDLAWRWGSGGSGAYIDLMKATSVGMLTLRAR
jgi:penicillin G amidase